VPDKIASSNVVFQPNAVDGKPWSFDGDMITAGPSAASNFYYPPEWINDPLTAKMYEGAQSYVNHMSEEELLNRPEGDMNDLVGYWSNVHPENSALKGRFNIIPTKENERLRDYCMASIRYRQKYPDKNLFGVSIVQMGDWVPFEIDGKPYRKVVRTNEVHSCDIVTKPGRGGMILAPATSTESKREWILNYMAESARKMEAELQKESGASATATAAAYDKLGTSPLISSDKGGLVGGLKNLRDMVAAADDSMPMKKELRRGLDNAISQAEIGSVGTEGEKSMQHVIKTEPGVTATISHAAVPPAGAGPDGAQVPTAHPEPNGDEEEATRCDEASKTFSQMAESEKNEEAKGKFKKQAEAFKKMAEARRAKAAEAKKQREAEEEAKKASEAEAKHAEGEGEDESEKESRRILGEMIVRDSGLSENAQKYILESTRGKNLSDIRKMIDTAKGLMKESGPGINPAKQVATGESAFKSGFKAMFSKGGRN